MASRKRHGANEGHAGGHLLVVVENEAKRESFHSLPPAPLPHNTNMFSHLKSFQEIQRNEDKSETQNLMDAMNSGKMLIDLNCDTD